MYQRNKEVEPYNKVLYNNCLYNTLLSACQHFGFNDAFILVNDFFTYKLSEKKDSIYIDRDVLKIKDDMKLLYELGIDCERNDEGASEFIKTCLERDKLIMVCIDQFYFHKSAFYERTHSMYHMLLFANREEEYHALALMDGQCVQTIISEDELLTGMKKKKKYFPEYIPEFDCFSLYYDTDKLIKNQENYELIFVSNYINCSEKLIACARLLGQTAEYYASFDFTALHNTDLEKYSHPVTHMIIAKKVQLYQNEVLFSNRYEIKQNLLQSLDNMRIVLVAFTKLQLFFRTNREVNPVTDMLCTQFSKLEKLECEYIDLLETVCSKRKRIISK